MRPLIGKLVLGACTVLLLWGCGNKDRNRATVTMNEGIEQAERGNYTGAVARLEAATRLDPDFGMPHYYLGMIRLQQYHSPDVAIPDLRRAADLMPEHAATFYLLGSAHLQLHEYREAEQALQRAVELDPHNAAAWLRLGELREANGQVMEAIDAYTRSIYADPRSPYGYSRLGSIYVQYEHPQEAIAVFRNGWENTQDPKTANDLGTALLETGQYTEAISVLQQAVTRQPDSVTYNYNLGLAYTQAYRESQNEDFREQARQSLQVAQARCAALGSQARCNAIRLAMTDLEEQQQPAPTP